MTFSTQDPLNLSPQPDEDVMLDGRYDPAFALYFTQRADSVDVPLPRGTAWVILGFLTIAALSAALAFVTLG